MSDESPKCDHDRSMVRVTNQTERYNPERAHASAWVCDDQRCIIDAMFWVKRFTGEKPWWRPGTSGEWLDTMPEVE